MCEHCGTAVAFNCFSTWYDNHPDQGFRIDDPLESQECCRGLKIRRLFRYEYLAYDFTVYMHRP